MTDAHAVSFGVDRLGNPVHLDPTFAHTVLSGATRSGKSVASYLILGRIADDPAVEVVGIDPSSILLTPFQRPGGGVIVGSSPTALDNAVELLRKLEAEMDERNRRLSINGLDKVPSGWLSPRFPSLLLVLEEYGGLLAAADKNQRPEVIRIVGRILREGAKASIFVYAVLQRPEAAVLHDRAQYARRISFRLDNADSVRMLFEGADPAQVQRIMDYSPGEGLLHLAGDPLTPFKARYLAYENYVAHVRASMRTRTPVPLLTGAEL